MRTGVDVWIDGPHEPVKVVYENEIAKIQINGTMFPCLRILLSFPLTPAERKAWLTNFARQVQLLAASIPVGDEPDAEVRTVLGVVGA